MQQNNNRLIFIDIMKCLAIYLVILGHILASSYNNILEYASTDYVYTALWRYIYSFHMPLFMFISGYVAFSPHKSYTFKHITLRIISYLIPFFVAGTLLTFWREKGDLSNYWYFRTLSIFVIILYIIEYIVNHIIPQHKKINRFIIFILYIILFKSLTIICNSNSAIGSIIDIKHIEYLYFYFIIGWGLRQYSYLLKYIVNQYTYAISAIGMFIHLIIFQNISILWPIIAIIFTINISFYLQKSPKSILLTQIGNRTLDIYIIHFFFLLKIPYLENFFINIANQGGITNAINAQLLVAIPLSSLLLYISTIISKLIRISPVLSLITLGDVNILKKKFDI